jgi:hypothetical protein
LRRLIATTAGKRKDCGEGSNGASENDKKSVNENQYQLNTSSSMSNPFF